MRVFYVDEDYPVIQYLVRIDNITVPQSLQGTITIDATNTEELIKKIMDYYGFKTELRDNIQLWSAPLGVSNRTRLDTLSVIPKKYIDIWVRGISNNEL
jgi:hypothetical protein